MEAVGCRFYSKIIHFFQYKKCGDIRQKIELNIPREILTFSIVYWNIQNIHGTEHTRYKAV